MENNRVCKKCGGISGWDSYFQSWICTRCGDMVQKSITNGDRIRAMTDEELAEYIRIFFPEVCPPGTCPGEDFCYKCWLDWLREEANKEINNE